MDNLKAIIFDKELNKEVLSVFDKKIVDGEIVESASGDLVLTKDGESIKADEFAGVTYGSEVYLKSDIASLVDYYEVSEVWGSENS